MPDAALRHDGDGHGFLDSLDHLRVAHAGHAARRADVGGNALERHDGAGSGLFGDVRLLGCGDVHDDAALEHLGELAIQRNTFGCGLRFWHFLLLLSAFDSLASYVELDPVNMVKLRVINKTRLA